MHTYIHTYICTTALQIVKVYPCRCSTTNEDENAASEKLVNTTLIIASIYLCTQIDSKADDIIRITISWLVP